MTREKDGGLDLLPSQWLAAPAPIAVEDPPSIPTQRTDGQPAGTGEPIHADRAGPTQRTEGWPAGTGEGIKPDRPERARRATPEHDERGRRAAPEQGAATPHTPGHRAGLTPDVYDRAGRRLFQAAFWSALAVSLGLWWLNTPARQTSSVGDLLLAGGRLTGLIGGYLLLAQVLMMSRVRWLERWIGAHSLTLWHRELGGALLVVILTHVGLTLVGYARLDRRPLVGEAWTVLTTYEDMISATVAVGILVTVGLLAVRSIRRRMPYELWYFIHLAGYLVLLFGYGHQFANGQELYRPGFGRWYWAGLYAFVLACLFWGRIVTPLVLNLRHRLKVADVVHEGPDMISIYISGRHLDRLDARAGQYFRWRFLARRCWWQAHPFSLSAAPNKRWLRLTIKVVGDHTAQLRSIRPGTRIVAEGPSGVFTADRRIRPRALLIAGGSGIAPIRALLEELPTGTVVIYRARKPEELVFRDELDWLAEERHAAVWYVLGRRDDPGPRQVFTPKGLRQLVPDVRHRDIFLCGPSGLVETSVKTLRKLRVPRRQIHLDPFEF